MAEPATMESLLEATGFVRGGKPVKDPSDEGYQKDGVPLTVVSTAPGSSVGEDADPGEEVVTLEDPDGVQFWVPISWMKSGVDPRTTHSITHTAITNQDVLGEIWRDAARQEYIKERQKLMKSGAIPQSDDIDASDVWSPLDIWIENNTVNPDYKGGFGEGYTPETQKPSPTFATSSNIFQASPRQLQRQNPTNKVQPVQTGWGNADEEWDPVRKRWVKMK